MLPLRLRLLKRLDRSIGGWLCRRARPAWDGQAGASPHSGVLSFPAKPVPKATIDRILVIRPGGIGDAVLTFPMLRALREHYEGASIDVLGERRNADVYRINGLVREVHCYDAGPLASPRLLRELAARRYPLIVDTEQYHHLSGLTAHYLRPTYICGFDTVGRGRLQTHRVRYTDTIYEVYSFLRLAETLIGHPIPFDRDQPFLEVDPRWRDWAAQTLAGRDQRPIAVIVPGASTPHKYWPPQRYAAVADWLLGRGYCVVVLGGRDALTLARIIGARHSDGAILNLAGQTSLPQTAGLIQRARLYISSDTGPLHIAYGVGTPTVHMFGSGIMEKWAPPGRRYVVVHKDLPCSPCTRYGWTPPCPYEVACMQAIQVEDVIAGIEEVLRR
jgi:lipopolysaccharide heptosyltransferase II